MLPRRTGNPLGVPVSHPRQNQRSLILTRKAAVSTGGRGVSLRGKVAVITGASRGIGLALARALGQEGCRLVLTSQNARNLEKAGRELVAGKNQALLKSCDVRDPVSVEKMISAVAKRFGKIEVLINNAGIGQTNTEVGSLDIREWQEVVETNLTGLFLVTRAALPLMGRGGAILNNLSISAQRVFPGMAAYNASKHGALGFTRTLREELRPKGIRVIALLPGATDTEIWNVIWPEAPRAKMMSAEAVAEAAVNALRLPLDATVEELVVLPPSGTL